jgi:hypothetical protein
MAGAIFFYSPKRPDLLKGPPSFLFSWCRCSSPGVKVPGCDVDHSPQSSEWSCVSSPICVHGVDRDRFSFLLISNNKTTKITTTCLYSRHSCYSFIHSFCSLFYDRSVASSFCSLSYDRSVAPSFCSLSYDRSVASSFCSLSYDRSVAS